MFCRPISWKGICIGMPLDCPAWGGRTGCILRRTCKGSLCERQESCQGSQWHQGCTTRLRLGSPPAAWPTAEGSGGRRRGTTAIFGRCGGDASRLPAAHHSCVLAGDRPQLLMRALRWLSRTPRKLDGCGCRGEQLRVRRPAEPSVQARQAGR